MSTPQTPAAPEKCPRSHLRIGFLNKIGKAVEAAAKESGEAGEAAVEAALDIALSNFGAFSEE